MDDEPLSLGKDYLVKLGTKTIPGILTKIEYAIDVNTGAHQATEMLNKNGIAVVEIVFAEGIVVDLFEKHKTLGELILIDRVTHATSACGVVEDLFERQIAAGEKAEFVQGERHGRGEIFEEFFYDTATLSVVKQQPVRQHYTVGDEIPTVGESYHYPDDFDIIILRDSVAVKVRGKRIAEITEAAKYLYDGFPVINGRGFEIKVFSDEDVSRLLREYAEAGEFGREEFFRKWATFNTYRKVVIK
jgi:sulfate adenylyltransferase subunit 1